MTRTKSNRIFLGIVTCAMALAGTGLTIANNAAKDVQILAIAITLAACFTAAEVTFLWAHKTYERVKKLWRKIVLVVGMVLLVMGMATAVWEELLFALHKVSNRSLAQNSSLIVEKADKRNQRSIGWKALDNLAKDKVQSEPWPFVVCYLITGLVSIVIVGVTEKEQARTIIGNRMGANPALQEEARKRGLDPLTTKAYSVRGGYALHTKDGYKHFVPNRVIVEPDDPKKWIL